MGLFPTSEIIWILIASDVGNFRPRFLFRNRRRKLLGSVGGYGVAFEIVNYWDPVSILLGFK